MAERLTELTAADQARVEAVLLEHGRYIEGVATRYAFRREAVPDIVQEVQLRICQSLPSVRQPQYLKTWLFKVTQNTAISMFRKDRRQMPDSVVPFEDAWEATGRIGSHNERRSFDRPVQEYLPDPSVRIEEQLIDDDTTTQQREMLHHGIKKALTPRQRQAVRHMITARRVKVSRRADHPAISRARKRLRKWMQDQGYETAVAPTKPTREEGSS